MAKSQEMAKSKYPKVNVNEDWFVDQMKSSGLTRAKTAKILKMDPAGITHFLKGRRHLSLEEAAALAGKFGRTLEEVMAHAGVKVRGGVPRIAGNPVSSPKEPSETLTVRGWVDAEMTIHLGPVKGPAVVPAPPIGGSETTWAVRVQTQGTRLDGLDGALFYFPEVTPKAGVSPDAIGKVSVVRIKKSKELAVRIVRKGYGGPGTYNLFLMNGEAAEAETVLEAAVPVVWMKF